MLSNQIRSQLLFAKFTPAIIFINTKTVIKVMINLNRYFIQ